MYGATFSMIKADGTEEVRLFHSTDVATLTAQVADLAKVVASVIKDRQAPADNPNDPDSELRKSLQNPKTSAQIEEQQAQSPRFVPRSNPHHGADAPWL